MASAFSGVGIFLFFLILLGGAAARYAARYQGLVYPGVFVGITPLGGLTGSEAEEFIENFNNRLSKEGLTIEVTFPDSRRQAVPVSVVTNDEGAVELVRFDSQALAKDALAAGRSPSLIQSLFRPLALRWGRVLILPAPAIINRPALQSALEAALAPLVRPPQNAGVIFTASSTQNYSLIPEAAGERFGYGAIISELTRRLSKLELAPLAVAPVPTPPEIKTEDIEAVISRAPIMLSAPLGLNFVDPQTNQRTDWSLSPAELAGWLTTRRDSEAGVIFTLDSPALTGFITQTIAPAVERPALEAKFSIAGGRVEEFQASQSGLKVDNAKTAAELVAAFEERNFEPPRPLKTVSVAVKITEPLIKTADLNALGITHIVGTGTSTFRGSHVNRIKNITTAIKRLNGVLIKPDEEFSTNRYAGPYTPENGYLPELVIKGSRIIPEVGGGMCQIGTTMFRLAMNSALPITERRNHSLVVNYYLDPVNRNPGTDATLYEPLIDFKFINDTGNYLLLQTEVDYRQQLLTFILWGRPDGRRGWYTHPRVSRWIAPGEPRYIETQDSALKPGETRCQEAYRGAVASFTYTRITPAGEQIDRVFDSYYRPLPKICLIGATAASSTAEGEAAGGSER